MPDAYCEPEDVRQALQEPDLSGPIDESLVTPAIQSASAWLRKRAGRHWYDSGGAASDMVATTPASATEVRLDVPSSPHSQRDQLFRADHHGVDVRYPVTTHGPYARLPLDHAYVESLDRLAVRDRAGEVTDWTSDPEFVSGRGEDYYLLEEDQEGHGASFLYVRAASIGPRSDYSGLVTVDYEYGLDAADVAWPEVRRGVANLAAAEVVEDDGVLTQIPDNARLVDVATEHQHYLDRAQKYLNPYMGVGVA